MPFLVFIKLEWFMSLLPLPLQAWPGDELCCHSGSRQNDVYSLVVMGLKPRTCVLDKGSTVKLDPCSSKHVEVTGNPPCLALLFVSFEIESPAVWHCTCQTRWSTTFWGFSCTHLPCLHGSTGITKCATTPGFTWFLGPWAQVICMQGSALLTE